MNIGLVVFVLMCVCLLYWRYRYTQEFAQTIEQSGYHAWATVDSYRKEYVSVAGSWDWLDYPYVVYKNAEGERITERLNYAENNRRLFAIGDEVEVVRYNGILYYRAALHPNYEWSYILWIIATIGALAVVGTLADYFTSSK